MVVYAFRLSCAPTWVDKHAFPLRRGSVVGWRIERVLRVRVFSLAVVIEHFFISSFFSCSLAAGSVYEATTVTNGGTIRGKVQYVGPAHPSQPVEISKDQAVCGK